MQLITQLREYYIFFTIINKLYSPYPGWMGTTMDFPELLQFCMQGPGVIRFANTGGQHARLLDTGGSASPVNSRNPLLPSAILTTSAPTERVISVLNHRGLLTRCLRLTPSVAAERPKTRFRVVTSLARVGPAPTGNQCTVSVN